MTTVREDIKWQGTNCEHLGGGCANGVKARTTVHVGDGRSECGELCREALRGVPE